MTRSVIRMSLNGVARVAPELAARGAFELWRRPLRRGRVRPSEQTVHDAARTGVVVQRGRRVRTYAWGDGLRPVLLVHGLRSRASRFAPLVRELLEAGFSPVSYDALGHGSTRGPAGTIHDHHAIIETLAERHGPFDGVVAHSLGVPFALYAVREGTVAGRVVAMSGVADFGYLVDAFCEQLGLDEALNPLLRRRIEDSLFAGDRGIWRRFSVGPAAGCELLVVHNDVDKVVDRTQADRILSAYGDRATLVETTGLGHSRVLGDPAVVRAAVAFLSAEAAVA